MSLSRDHKPIGSYSIPLEMDVYSDLVAMYSFIEAASKPGLNTGQIMVYLLLRPGTLLF